MSTNEFWKQITERGEMRFDWWYEIAVLPAFILAILIFLLMLFALRRERKFIVVYVWMFIASLPIVLVTPSFSVSQSPFDMLEWVDFKKPPNIQAFRLDHINTLSNYLDQMATIGIIGGAILIVTFFASMIVGRMVPEPIAQTFTNITQAVTRAFGKRGGRVASVKGAYGSLRITRGQHKGNVFAIADGALIGKSDASLIVTDPIVSRRHARIEIRGGDVFLVDQQSTNGTYLMRDGTPYEIVQPTQLYPGDTIYLGDPNDSQSVELAYDPPSIPAQLQPHGHGQIDQTIPVTPTDGTPTMLQKQNNQQGGSY